MILFGLILTVLSAYDGDYVECFDHKTCRDAEETKAQDKIYCYAGTCTERCPPGYIQKNYEKTRDFTCECDEEKGLVVESYFEGLFANLTIPKCKCDKDFCLVTVWSQGIGYTDGLVPNGAPPNCKAELDQIPAVISRFSYYMVLITMTMFMLIHCRSSSGIVYDFHRYYGLYVLGSMMVIVFVQTVYPFTAGFTRTMAFGIVAHNSAEWNVLLRLQYGKTYHVRNSSNICLMMYYIILLLAMSFLPLGPLLYFSMIQGGFLDYTFVWFIYAARKAIYASETHEHVSDHCFKNEYARFVCWFGFGAIFHLLSVEILFAGFILNNASFIGGGGFLLLPMFLFYTIWVFGQERFMICCGPSVFMQYIKSGISESSPTHFLIVPFKHTTRTVDIFWKRFVGEGYAPAPKVDVEMESLDVIEVERVGSKAEMEDGTAQDKFEFSTGGKFEVQDCESFKFGINDEVRKCPMFDCCPCKFRIPCYWVCAFICISINTAVLMHLPKWVAADGCNQGYELGAW